MTKWNITMLLVFITLLLLLPCSTIAQNEDKVAVLITGWGMPAGYSFDYSWHSSEYARCGDKTEYEGQPCKIGHVGEFPYQAHFNIIPWAICFETPDYEHLYDNSGIYILQDGVYVSPNPEISSVLPSEIPEGVPVTPLVEVTDHTGKLTFPSDPRDGEDYLDGWFKIGDTSNLFSNGFGDLAEQGPAYFTRYIGFITGPSELPEAHQQNPYAQEMEDYTEQKLHDAFGDRIDVRSGYYGEAPGYSELAWDVAEQFANEGFTKMLLARETTDHNNYANHFFTGGYVRERLCEIGKLDDTEIFQTYQVGRTPEFNTMNIMNMKRFIEGYPEGSTIAIVYATRGLSWGQDETTGYFAMAHPWSKEIYFENAYLNYLSWKKAVQDAYGDKYDLVFTKGRVESDLREDNLFTFGLSTEIDLLGYEEEHVYYGLRDAIEFAVEDGIDKIIIAPCHWNYDNLDTIMRMKEINNLPLTPKEDLEAGIFEMTHCEDAEGNVVLCGSPAAVAEITVAPSYSNMALEFSTAYYVVLQGTLERFGLFPDGEEPVIEASQLVTKLNGGTIEVTSASSPIQGTKIEIAGDPYPERPQGFTPETALPVNDPLDTNDCMWEDTIINIGYRATPPSMNDGDSPLGPAVHFGPYRTFFNRDVTITIPYNSPPANGKTLGVYIYNHLTENWDELEIESSENGFVTFKTMVLGLFQVAEKESENICPALALYGNSSKETELLRNYRDEVLSKTFEGQELIKLYYKWSPAIVKAMAEDNALKDEVRIVIDGVLMLLVEEK
ncbi:MAG: hypothetical protein JRJ00_05050 [Deltaproteobacteria bacterium]|nr:hypothetical protein [Deltaproteobacteria bacterium]